MLRPAFACIALAVLSAPAEELVFGPEAGASVTRRFGMTSSISLDHQSAVFGGEEQEMDGEQEGEQGYSIVVTDVYGELDGSRVLSLERTFDEILHETSFSASMRDQEFERESTGTSELEGETVLFTWDPDAEEYVATSESVDDGQLEDLRMDLDWAFLVPGEAVDEDDSWSIDPEDFRHVFRPGEGIELDWEHSDGLEQDESDESEEPEPDESHSGDITATYAGTREDEGRTLGVIRLEGELVREMSFSFEDEFEHGSVSQETEESRTLEFEGELLWDLEAGRLGSLELEGDLEIRSVTESVYDMGQGEMESTMTRESSGTMTITCSYE